jgi:hypothetical protein
MLQEHNKTIYFRSCIKQAIQNFSHDSNQKKKSQNRETIATKVFNVLLASTKLPCQCSWWPLVINSKKGAIEIPHW